MRIFLRFYFLMLVLLAAVLCSSCSGLKAKPKTPAAIKASSAMEKLFADVDPSNPDKTTNWYQSLTKRINDEADDSKKRAMRDEHIYALKTLIDNTYQAYREKYYGAKSAVDFAGDATNILLTGAGTIAGGARVKTVLSAVATATSGLSGKAGADFWGQQSQAVIVTRMDALRSTQYSIILTGMKQDSYSKYTVAQAFNDLGLYFYAGTPANALADILTQTGEKQRKATDDINRKLGVQ